ncbi:carbohydrate sulfotransferase 13 [Lingula anatina]|uniref:Carbohydrate sulfotransferase n=1 Tax=Lingula anatina TaxID=7574 RepID=A0A1S3JSP7_LINAN|nr:carbohydrate sulfotransferase 13 [Lingula anatina]|eukprot:XP_013413064.1 carbohydrate sulfotransferase 13 [Lingula anatina]
MKTRSVVIRGIAIFTVGIIAWMAYASLKIRRNDTAVDEHAKETGLTKGETVMIGKDKYEKTEEQTFPNIIEISEANLQAKASPGKAETSGRNTEATWNISKTKPLPKTRTSFLPKTTVEAETLKNCKSRGFAEKLLMEKDPKMVREKLSPRTNASSINTSWAETIVKRKEFIRRKCALHKIKTSPLPAGRALHQFWVDDNHKFIFCEIPKVGCTNWKRIMLLMTCKFNKSYIWSQKKNDVHHVWSNKALKRLKSFTSRSDSDARLKNYTKVLITRHPFERLVSFFREKLERAKNDIYDPRIAGYVLRSIHKKRDVTHKMMMEYNVTFPEYIQYVIDTKMHPDVHWGIQHSLCHPCSVDYEVIGRYETIVEDSNNLLKMLGIDEITYPQSDNVDFAKKTKDLVSKHFQTLKPWMIKELHTMYKTDADIFGYDLDLK